MDLYNLRHEYHQAELSRKSLHTSPFSQFEKWMEEALKAGVIEANAMALATADRHGKPFCRMVLMKAFDTTGLTFFTNLTSSKGQQLHYNPQAAVVFWWKELERQVRVEGDIQEVCRRDVQMYFSRRPRASQLATKASRQSQVIPSRHFLEEEVARLQKVYENAEVPLPEEWGGFKLIPTRFEFWQGRAERMSDRFSYALINEVWQIDRLSP